MKNAQINKDRKKPSSKEIEETKDFNFVLKNQSNNKYKTLKIAGYISIVIIGFIASKTYLQHNKTNKVITTKTFNNKEESKRVTPNSETIVINPSKKQTILLKDQSILNIPSNAFINNKNEIEKGSVTLKYSYFKTVPEIFLSNIPMIYDSAQTQYHFESAGMFKLKAFDRNGKVLTTNPHALIEVEMSSNNDAERFNSYYLANDSVWEYLNSNKAIHKYIAKNTIEARYLENQQKIKSLEQKIEGIIKTNIPKVPMLANKDRYALNLDFDEKKFSELSPFKNILFEVLPINKEFDIDEITTNWNELDLDKINNQYVIILYKKGIKRTIFVQPVITIDEEEANQTIFDNLYEKSKLEKVVLYKEKQAEVDSLKNSNKSIEDSIAFINRRAVTQGYYDAEEAKNQALVFRTFTIEKFGVYNSDCPANLPSGISIEQPIFVNKKETKDTLRFQTLYLAEYGTNTIYTLYGSFKESLSFNPTKPAVIWGITDKNKLAVYNLKNYNKKLKLTELPMELNELTNETNADSIRKALQWQ